VRQKETPEVSENPTPLSPWYQRRANQTATALANLERDRQANQDARLGMKTPMVRGPLWTKRRGEVSELAFFYKAASLGFGVAKPWGDSERYDFILDSGQRLWRVQVKSGCHHHNRYYDLSAKCGNRARSQYTSREIDIFVAYLVPIDVWYVIPVDKIKKKSLLFYPYGGARCGHYERYREAWSLMAPSTDASCSSLGLQTGRLQPERLQPGYLNPRFL
jgi:PD-(D/E)XK endonuclease